MSIHQQFKSIIEEGKVSKLYPFLKKLTHKEKRELAPTIKSVNRYYNEEVQKGVFSFGVRGKLEQRLMTAAAGFVCFTQKEFNRARMVTLSPEIARKILQFYQPEWFGDHLNKAALNGESLKIEIDYDLMMSLHKAELIQPNGTLITRLLGEYLYDAVPGLIPVVYKRNNQNLFTYPETLKDHIWLFFEHDLASYPNDKTEYHPDISKRRTLSWRDAFIELSQEGKIDRQRLLKGCLDVLSRNVESWVAAWMSKLFDQLKPTHLELYTLRNDLIQTLIPENSTARGMALKYLRKLAKKANFPVDDFLENVPLLLVSGNKTVVSRTLMILNILPKTLQAKAAEICQLTTQAFVHNDLDIQKRAVKIIDEFGDEDDHSLVTLLIDNEDNILAHPKASIKRFFDVELDDFESDLEEEIKYANLSSPSIPVLSSENEIPIPDNFDDIIFLASQAFENHNPLDIDILPAVLINYNHLIDSTNIERFAPALKHAFQVVVSGRRRLGGSTHLLATFFLHYMKHQIKRFSPHSQILKEIWNETIRENRGHAFFEGILEKKIVPLAKWPEMQSKSRIYNPFRYKLIEVLGHFHSGTELPLLSTPTHHNYWIDPKILIERLRLWQKESLEIGNIDFQLALSRTWLKGADQYLDEIVEHLDGEIKEILLFFFDEKARPNGSYENPAWWWVAAITKTPQIEYPEFSGFSYSQNPFEECSGDLEWRLGGKNAAYFEWKNVLPDLIAFWDYETAIHIKINPGQGIGAGMKGFFGKIVKLTEGNQEMIYDEIEFERTWWEELSGDIRRIFSLFPNHPERLFAITIHRAMQFSKSGTEDHKRTIINLVDLLIDHPLPLGKMGHLFLAAGMINAEKSGKALAGEYWAQAVENERINNQILGETLAHFFYSSFAPIKRLTDLMTDRMMRISVKHDQALKELLEHTLKWMRDSPQSGLKKLLEIYRETLRKTGDKPAAFLDSKFKVWRNNAGLRKIIDSLASD